MPASQAPWRVIAEFTGIDLADDDVFEALVAEHSPHVEWSSCDGVTTADAVIDAASPATALDQVVEIAVAASPDAAVLRVIDPLVTVSDIAELAGVTRQAVRHWATGARHSGFPRPLATVGDGVRVWREADVDAWLSATVGLGSGQRFPTAAEVLVINDRLSRCPGDPAGGHRWRLAFSRTEVQSEIIERHDVPAPRRPRAKSPAAQ